MIDVVFALDGTKLSASIKGHAGAGEYGHDLVCASASILAYTLAQNVYDMEGRCAVQDEPIVHLEPGNSYIECTCVGGHLADVINVFLVIATGYDLLADRYSEYLQFTNLITNT